MPKAFSNSSMGGIRCSWALVYDLEAQDEAVEFACVYSSVPIILPSPFRPTRNADLAERLHRAARFGPTGGRETLAFM